jgi:hypothetical protein
MFVKFDVLTIDIVDEILFSFPRHRYNVGWASLGCIRTRVRTANTVRRKIYIVSTEFAITRQRLLL